MRAVAGQVLDPLAWLPFVVVALLKGCVLLLVARFDWVPWFVLVPALAIAPGLVRHVHYPDLPLHLPLVAQTMDIVSFVTIGVFVQAVVMRRLGAAWGRQPVPLFGPVRGAIRRGMTLVVFALVLLAVPVLALRVTALVASPESAALVALLAGGVISLLLFTAPAFVVFYDIGAWKAVRASVALVAHLPISLPLAVVAIAILHVPGIILRTPAIRAGAAQDPDWILAALAGQLPAEVVGGFLAAGLSAYFAVRTRVRRKAAPGAPLVRVATTMLVVVALGACAGCAHERDARNLTLRYDAERCVERARLREGGLETAAPVDTLAWLGVAQLYGDAVERVGAERSAKRAPEGLEHDLARLACQGLLGRAAAYAHAGRLDVARAEFSDLIDHCAYRGVCGDAALELARVLDAHGNWPDAVAAYEVWLRGVQDGRWPLHANGVEIAGYVVQRFQGRGDQQARTAWVERGARALEAAAERGEEARDARTARFALLLGAGRWDDAFTALHDLRARHDPEGHDGGMLVAEASLLASGLRRDKDALGILAGLSSERATFDNQHRVLGWLLAGQIHMRAQELDAADDAFTHAAAEARSEAGRSEATLGLARVEVARGDIRDARRLYAQLRDVYPATAAGLVAPLEEIRMLREHGQADEAHTLVPEVMQGYRSVIQQFGTERPALLAARFMSECFGLEGHWERSVAFLDSVSASFGNDPRAGSLLELAAHVAVEQLADKPRAVALLSTVQLRYPGTDVAVLAQVYADSLGAPDPLP